MSGVDLYNIAEQMENSNINTIKSSYNFDTKKETFTSCYGQYKGFVSIYESVSTSCLGNTPAPVIQTSDLISQTQAYMANIASMKINSAMGGLTNAEQLQYSNVLTQFYKYIIDICNIYTVPTGLDATNADISDTEHSRWVYLTAFAILEEALSTTTINTQSGINIADVLTAFNDIQTEFTETYANTLQTVKNMEELIANSYDSRYSSVIANLIDTFKVSYVRPTQSAYNDIAKGGGLSVISAGTPIMNLYDTIKSPNNLQTGAYLQLVGMLTGSNGYGIVPLVDPDPTTSYNYSILRAPATTDTMIYQPTTTFNPPQSVPVMNIFNPSGTTETTLTGYYDSITATTPSASPSITPFYGVYYNNNTQGSYTSSDYAGSPFNQKQYGQPQAIVDLRVVSQLFTGTIKLALSVLSIIL